MNDTSPDIEKKIHELTMKFSGADRVRLTSGMFEAARTLVLASIPTGTTAVETRLRLCERFYSGEVDLTAFSDALRKSAAAT
jgi:hypothetical protein